MGDKENYTHYTIRNDNTTNAIQRCYTCSHAKVLFQLYARTEREREKGWKLLNFQIKNR